MDKLGGTCTNYGCDAKILLDGPFEFLEGFKRYEGLCVDNVGSIDWTKLMAYKKENLSLSYRSMSLVRKAQRLQREKHLSVQEVAAELGVSEGKVAHGWDMGTVDATIVTTQMMYAAEELGLGTLWVGGTGKDYPKIMQALSVPDFLFPVAILEIGYPAEDAKPHPVLHESRYPLKDTVYYGSFEGIEAGKPGRHNI